MNILNAGPPISLTDLSEEMGISKVAVLKIVMKLERQGVVIRHYIHSGTGRPACMIAKKNSDSHIYTNLYEDIVYTSFTLIRSLLGDTAIEEILDKGNARMKREIDGFDAPDTETFLEMFREQRNNEGYSVEIMKGEDKKLEIFQYNCPLITIAETLQSCCNQERVFLSDVLKRDVLIRETIRENGKRCHFSAISYE
jgi:Predicted transcriptional regulator